MVARMITRVGDPGPFDDEQLQQLASRLANTPQKKLYHVAENLTQARILEQELRVKGYQSSTYQVDGGYEVYALASARVDLQKAEDSGLFKRLAFGQYVFEKNASWEMHSYPFDDGSIWRVALDEDGNQILVKEVSDFDKNQVKRVPKEDNVRTASLGTATHNDTWTHILFNDLSDFYDALMGSSLRTQVITWLDDRANNMLRQLAQEFKIPNDKLADLESMVMGNIDHQIKDLTTLQAFVKAFAENVH